MNFLYDPSRQGYDDTSIWKTLSGSPSVSNDAIVLNNASIIQYADLRSCNLLMRLELPSIASDEKERSFGFRSNAMDEEIVFSIINTDVYIRAKSSNSDPVELKVDIVSSDWFDQQADFEIRWRGPYADFLINGIKVLEKYRINKSIPYGPLSVFLSNKNNDNMNIISISATDIKSFI